MKVVITYLYFGNFHYRNFSPNAHSLQFSILWVQAKLRAEEAKQAALEAERKAAMEAEKQAAKEAEKKAEAERRAGKYAAVTSERVTSGGTQLAAGHQTDTASSLSNAETKESGIYLFIYFLHLLLHL